MIELENFLLFLGLSWILIVTPGPDLIYVLTRGIANGKEAGILSALGVSLGILVHTILAALGLSVVLQTSALAFSILKILGAGYLIYIGIKSFMNLDPIQVHEGERTSKKKVFTQGLLSNTLNPKVALFFIAFLPQFINTNTQVSITMQLIILGLIFGLCTLIFLTTLGYFSGRIGLYLNRNKSFTKWMNQISGSILIGLGIRLAFLQRQ